MPGRNMERSRSKLVRERAGRRLRGCPWLKPRKQGHLGMMKPRSQMNLDVALATRKSEVTVDSTSPKNRQSDLSFVSGLWVTR